MSFFNDFANAVESYPADSVTLTITDIAVESGTGGSVNVNEVWKFKVQVENNGHLNMTDVALHVSGLDGTTIGTKPAGSFLPEQIVGSLKVNGGGGSRKSDFLYFKAPSIQKPAGTNLFEVHISDWSGNIDHMFTNHTNHSTLPTKSYPVQVFP